MKKLFTFLFLAIFSIALNAEDFTGIRLSIAGVEYENGAVCKVPYGTSVEVKVVSYPEDADYGTITYKVSDTKIGTYSKYSGKFAATGSIGQTVLTATSGNDASVTTSVTIDVFAEKQITDINVEGVDANGEIRIGYQEMQSINYTLEPADASVQKLNIQMDNPGIVTIYAAKAFNPTRDFYELTAFKVGETNVTYTAQDGSGVSKTIKIIVEDRERDAKIDYTKGHLWLNEEWFGHNNGSINFIDDDYNITYKAYERENPWCAFGATSQYGIVYGGNLLVMSKQAKDGGDPRDGGGRLVIADAKTLKRKASFDELGADGRACVGARHNKYYIGTATGVRVLEFDGNNFVLSDSNIEGIAGKNAYSGQVGDMISAGDYVFICQQSTGLHIVDAVFDKLVKTVADTGAAGVTQTADGTVWFIAGSKLYKINPETLEVSDPMTAPKAISCNWGAWTSTSFFGSKKTNTLFFVGGNASWNATKTVIYKWNTDEDMPTEPLCEISADSEGVLEGACAGMYGTARYDDMTNEIMFAATTGASSNYRNVWYYFIDAETGKIKYTTKLRPGYFFPSIPVIVDRYAPEFIDFDNITVSLADGEQNIDLSNIVIDRDDINYNIEVTLDNSEVKGIATVGLDGKSLYINPLKEGDAKITLYAISRGVITEHKVALSVTSESGVSDLIADGSVVAEAGKISVKNYEGETLNVYDIAGRIVETVTVPSDNFTLDVNLSSGVYVVKVANKVVKIRL